MIKRFKIVSLTPVIEPNNAPLRAKCVNEKKMWFTIPQNGKACLCYRLTKLNSFNNLSLNSELVIICEQTSVQTKRHVFKTSP